MKSGGCHGEHCVGEALYRNDVNGTGWAYLEVETRDRASDVVQAYSAGYLEGWVTRELLHLQYQNTIGRHAGCFFSRGQNIKAILPGASMQYSKTSGKHLGCE